MEPIKPIRIATDLKPLFIIFSVLLASLSPKGWKAYQSLSWPCVDGEIVKAKIEMIADEGGSIPSLTIKYKYIVDGSNYLSTRVSYGFLDVPPIEMRKGPFDGKKITVYFDPEKPFHAVLIPGFTNDLIGCFATLLFILILLTIYVFKNKSFTYYEQN